MTLVQREAEQQQAGQRLDSVLALWPEFVSRSAATRLIEVGQVTVNDQAVPKNYRLAPGDLICADIEADLEPGSNLRITPEPIPIDIRYEDDDLIVLSKQAGLVVHPAQGNWTGTLANALAWHFDELGQAQGAERPGIVHRLDKDTSGLMLAAKRDEAQIALQDAIRQRTVDRRYLCLVHGWISQDTGLIDAPLARDARDPYKRAVSDHPSAKSAVTTFTVLERFEAGRFDDGYTLLECKLFTGRTHQIRVHMAYIGHPMVGDPIYGRRAVKANRGLQRQFLHSYSLAFTHPATGVDLRFSDGLPADLQSLIDVLAPLSAGRTAEGEKIREKIGDGSSFSH
ncbi:MAG: RluA family pseudouridine synthase [Coriobacteriia bacterium]|nr:RluA family pseudouridine synthase [Coriobacteriia bacterium]